MNLASALEAPVVGAARVRELYSFVANRRTIRRGQRAPRIRLLSIHQW